MLNHTILIRCDLFPGSGAGHLKRCSVLANALKKLGFSAIFVIDEVSGPLPLSLDFPIHRISGTFDNFVDAKAMVTLAKWIGTKIILGDSYRISQAWVALLRSAGLVVILIDELGIGSEACLRIDYSPVPKQLKGPALSLLGPRYFITDSLLLNSRSSSPKRMIAHAGGTGNFFVASEVYAAALHASEAAGLDIAWLCPTDATYSCLKEAGLFRDGHEIVYWKKGKNNIWSEFDIVVGPASTSLFEAILQGALPVSFPTSNTQASERDSWLKIGHALHLTREEISSRECAEHIINLSIDYFVRLRSELDFFAKQIDGKGAERCAATIADMLLGKSIKSYEEPMEVSSIRKCDLRDANSFLDARNAPLARAVSTDTDHIIKWHEHLRWWLNETIERFVVVGIDETEAFFWHRPIKVWGRDYLIGGWFPAGKSPSLDVAVKLLDWQLGYCAKKYPEHIWLATIKKENRAVILLNRYYQFISGDPESHKAVQELFPGTNDDFVVLQRKARI